MQSKINSGRSMVEMLGVLAVIGVLTVGGVMGFRRAMNTHRANNLMNDVSILGMAVATRDQAVFNADCHNYEEASFTIPREFATCTATYGSDDLVVLTVTYNDQMPDRVIRMIENRCTQGIYVSTGATQFTVGSHGWNCELAAMEREQGPEDPSEWECQSANDCGFLAECRNHKCRSCGNGPEYVGPETFSETCCQLWAAAWDNPISYKNGKCDWNADEIPDEEKCEIHQKVFDEGWRFNCFACMSSNLIYNYSFDGEGAWCCGENESKSACCAAIGKSWCEKANMCLDSANDCETICATHTELTSQSQCDCYWDMVIYDPTTGDPAKSFCCDMTNNEDDADCCEAAGGYWDNNEWECYSEKPQQEKGTCIKMLDWRDFNN